MRLARKGTFDLWPASAPMPANDTAEPTEATLPAGITATAATLKRIYDEHLKKLLEEESKKPSPFFGTIRNLIASLSTDQMTRVLTALAELPERVRVLEAEVDRLRERLAIAEQGNPEELLTVDQAADLLHMSPAAVRKAAARGKLPAVRLGRRLRFKRGSLLSRLR